MTLPESQDSQRLEARLAAAIAARYRLDRQLGRGGMATVYLAHDLRHDRPVALKVLHPELAAVLGPERFQREILLAARLQHPHVLTVHDSGEDAGRLWFTMPYVEGESLRDRLAREKQLPVDEATRITREAAQGLEYAHKHGVVHRDIKPENLLLTEDGTTLVADFGIARSLVGGGEQLTATGLSVGTAAYMSPEQAAGESNVDARSDVYSLGCVLYEMLAGEPPFTGPTAQVVIARRFNENARPLREIRDTVPESVERAVQQALARTPADRFASAAEFARALAASASATASAAAVPPVRLASPPGVATVLRRPAVAAVLVTAVIAIGALLVWGQGQSASPSDAPPAIAVLPFENLGDSADAYFADGIGDAVRGKLTGLPGITVIARGSSLQYRDNLKAPGEVARELGVRYLLTGTVRWARQPGGASRVQVSPELVEVAGDGAAQSRWQEPFDAEPTDVFRVQAEIAGKVAEAMRVALGGADQARLAQAPTANTAAYDAFLRAEAAWNGGANASPAALRRAIPLYERAVALDSTFAEAWAGISTASSILYGNSTPSPDLAQRAKAAAERAAALDPDGTIGHRTLATYYRTVEQDEARALAENEAAYRRAPGDAAVLGGFAAALRVAGRWEEALRHAQAAHALDPRVSGRNFTVGSTYLWLRRPAEARPLLERAIALAPANMIYIQQRAMISLSEGDLPAAQQVFRAATEIPADRLAAFVAQYWDLGWALDDAGQRLALSLGPEAYDDDRAQWGMVRTQLHAWRGDVADSRAWADTAARYFEANLRGAPNNATLHVLRGLALAYGGRFQEAIASGERAVTLSPPTVNAYLGQYYLHQLVRIYLLAGDHERALERLELLMSRPYNVSPRWLRIDPAFAPLKGSPRFERLAGG